MNDDANVPSETEILSADAHPLVATWPLLAGNVAPLPGAVGQKPAGRRPGRRTMRTVRAVGEALFSDGKVAPAAGPLDWACDEYGDLMSRATAKGRLIFLLATVVVSVFAPIGVRRLPGLHRLDLATRVRALSRFEEGRLGFALVAIRALLCLVYYEHPEVGRSVGLHLSRPGSLTVEAGT